MAFVLRFVITAPATAAYRRRRASSWAENSIARRTAALPLPATRLRTSFTPALGFCAQAHLVSCAKKQIGDGPPRLCLLARARRRHEVSRRHLDSRLRDARTGD